MQSSDGSYKHLDHKYMWTLQNRVCFGKRPAGCLGSLQGHHGSAYALAPLTVKKIMRDLSNDSLENYDLMHGQFTELLLDMGRNHVAYYHLVSGREHVVDGDSYYTNRLKKFDSSQLLSHDLSVIHNVTRECCAKSNHALKVRQKKNEITLPIAVGLRQIMVDSESKSIEFIDDASELMRQDVLGKYREVLDTMANEYLIQSNRRPYSSFPSEGNENPDGNAKKRKMAVGILDSDDVPDGGVDQASPIGYEYDEYESVKVKQSLKYLSWYEEQNLQVQQLYQSEAVTHITAMFWYPRIKSESYELAGALCSTADGKQSSQVDQGGKVYKIVEGRLVNKYRMGVVTRVNDIQLASLVVVDHMTRVFDCFSKIKKEVKNNIYKDFTGEFSSVTWDMNRDERQVFETSLAHYNHPWQRSDIISQSYEVSSQSSSAVLFPQGYASLSRAGVVEEYDVENQIVMDDGPVGSEVHPHVLLAMDMMETSYRYISSRIDIAQIIPNIRDRLARLLDDMSKYVSTAERSGSEEVNIGLHVPDSSECVVSASLRVDESRHIDHYVDILAEGIGERDHYDASDHAPGETIQH